MTPEQIAASGSEDAHQAALFAWAATQAHECLKAGKNQASTALQSMFAIPNGGSRHKAEAGKLKATGVKAGVPDIFLPATRYFDAGYGRIELMHGLFIELKREDRCNHKNGGCSDDQIAMHAVLRQAGYHVAVCYTWTEAAEVVVKYLI